MKFGERLREIRREKGFTAEAMAEAIRMTQQGYSRLETGAVGKSFDKLPRIAKMLGCSIDDLFPEMDGDGKTDDVGGFEAGGEVPAAALVDDDEIPFF